MSLFLFACTILDLYLVMKNPFANNEKRVKIMIGVSITAAIALATTGLFLTRSKNTFIS